MSLKRFVLLTSSHEGSSLAQRAKREGLDVLTAVVQDWTETYTPEELKADSTPEDPLDKERRLKTFSGIVPQTTPQKMIKALGKLSGTEKQQTYVFSDMNYNFKFSEDLLALGIPGNFPLLEDRTLESDRELGKKFVQEHYTDLKVSEVHDFHKVQDALDFLEENMSQGDQAKLWVLKSNDAGQETIVPLNSDSAEQALATIKTALEGDAAGYEGKGFILEEFIRDAVELTPQVVFYDGVPIYYSCDIEIKKKGSGLSGRTTGCAANVVFRTDPEDKINKMAFPPIIYQMAKQRKGLFIWDSSILCDPNIGDYYFGEFCCNRWGWDCTQTEMTMAEGVTKYFDKIMAGEAPYRYGKFGFAVRIFNELDDKDIPGHARPEVKFDVQQEVADYVWPMYVYQDGEEVKSSGYGEDLAVVTCVADTIEEAAEGCYHYLKKVGFKDYSRLSLDDVLSTRSAGTIINRFKYGNYQGLYNVRSGDNSTLQTAPGGIMKAESVPLPAFMPTGDPIFDALNQSLSNNVKLKEDFETKIKVLKEEHNQQLLKALETLRTEMALKSVDSVKTAQQTTEFTAALALVGNAITGLKNSFSSLEPKPVDLSGVVSALALLPEKSDAVEQVNKLTKISDSFFDLGKSFVSLEKAIKEKQDPGYKLIVAAINNLSKHFEKQIKELSKSNEKIIVTSGSSGGGKGNIAGLIQVSYDYVALSNYSGNNPQTIQFYQGGSAGRIVGKLTITYDGSGNILTVTKVF